MKKVAIVGIQGVPAKYGGFETFVENIIGDNCSHDIHYTVFCAEKSYATRRKTYKGASLKYVPLFHANGPQSTLYDIFSMLKCLTGYDAVLILGVSGAIFLPVFRLLYRKRIIVNIDGLEYKRAKWGKFTKWFLRICTTMAVHCSDVLVSDNKGIQDYVKATYHRSSFMIAYGGDHVKTNVSEERQRSILLKCNLTDGNYAICISRIEPENNVHLILETFAKTGKDLVFIGNWERSKYSRDLKEKYAPYPHIRMLSSIYDTDILYALRSHCDCYIHGHSAGGTNPSLVEAMHFGMPILAYDVVYNRETTENSAYYFKSSEQLAELLERKDKNGESMKAIADSQYTWKRIAEQYESLY
ncbi:MAG: DUF1972 domain-containing protein [Prevotella sp.]|jgi:glycosyltransferase involved in cell wall biosynthesis|nr:DUF1972 domain-containing protein [Prevotella sp.]